MKSCFIILGSSAQRKYSFKNQLCVNFKNITFAFMKKKILITGASGFIGSAVVDKALLLGYDVWAGIRPSSSKQYLKSEQINFVYLDFSNKSNLKAQLSELANAHGKFDYIVHLAGLTKAINRQDFYDVNYHQVRNFAEVLAESDLQPRLFVFMSTLGVMGLGDEVGYLPMPANAVPNPNTEYGKSKLKAETFLKSMPGFPYLILRPTGVYGPRDRDYLILMRAVKSGLSVGAGFQKQILSFVYVEDLVQIILSAIDNQISRKEYNVSDGHGYTDEEFNNIVKQQLGRQRVLRLKLPLVLVRIAAFANEKLAKLLGKATTFNTDKYWIMKQRNWQCDISPLQEDIGFEPQYLLEDGVAKTIEWYRDNGWL